MARDIGGVARKQIADELVSSVAASDHFSIDKSETVIYGICADCKGT